MKGIKKTSVVVLLVCLTFFSGVGAEELSDNSDDVEPLPVFNCLIEPSEIVDVSSPVPGVIQHIFADRGDVVALGSPLSKLNSTVEQAALELASIRANSTAEIELQHEQAEFSKRLHSRNQALFRKSIISSHDMDRFETEQRVAEMQERQAKNKNRIAQLEFQRTLELLKQRTILSPIKGVVMERYKSAGEYVEDEPLLRLAQLDPLHIEIIVMAEYWGRLVPGQQAEVTPQLLSLDKKVATIERIDPVVDSASGTFRVQLKLPNPDNQIIAGLKCHLAILPEKADVETDELASLSPEAGKHTVPSDTTPSNITPDETELIEVKSDQTTSGGTTADVILPSLNHAALLLSVQQPDVSASQSEINTKSCFAVGPISEEKTAEQLIQQLTTAIVNQSANQSLKVTMRQEAKSVAKDYLIHSPPLSGWADVRAFINRLKAAEIMDFNAISNKETNHYAVSLGLYQGHQRAINRVNRLTDKGFEVELKPRYQESITFWLNLSQVNDKVPENEIRKTVSHLAPLAGVNSIGCDQLLVQNKTKK